jgi:PAS domain S-box-containing protein
MADRFYSHLESVPHLSAILDRSGVPLVSLRGTLREWARELLTHPRTETYRESRLQVGRKHAQIGLRQHDFLAAVALIRESLVEILRRDWKGPAPRLEECLAVLHRAIDADVAAICDAYVEESERELRKERTQERAALLRVHEQLLRAGGELPDLEAVRKEIAGFVPVECIEVVLDGGRGVPSPPAAGRRAPGVDRVSVALRTCEEPLGEASFWGPGLRNLDAQRRPFLTLVADALAQSYANHIAHHSLQMSEEKYRDLAETTDSMIVGLDRDGRVTLFNRYAAELTGYGPEDVLGRQYFDVFLPSPEVRRRVEEDVRKVLSGTPTRGFENDIRCKDGSLRSLLWNARRRVDADGTPVGLIAVGTDITDRRRAEVSLRESEKLAAIGRMATSVAHEVKNPLAGIKGVIGVFEKGLSADHPHREMCQLVRQRIDGLVEYVDDVVNFAKPLTLQRQRGTFRDLVERVIPLVRAREKSAGVRVRVTDRTKGAGCEADFLQLDRALLNVLLNAVDAAGEKGTVDVAASVADGAFEIVVSDTGPGFSPEILERVGEPFLSNKAGGTGLGLSITKRIVEAHGGTLSVANGSRGAVVRMRLPCPSEGVRPGAGVWPGV